MTIETACEAKHPYAITDKAMAALIDLCADICRRNGIKKLLWQGDKSLVGNIAKQNMTVHRWFAPKACPGDYIYNRLGDIAAKVNAKLGTTAAAPVTPAAPVGAVPYSAYERGSNENGNRMIRRKVPKGTDFTNITEEDTLAVQRWVNEYPRGILGGRSAGRVLLELAQEAGVEGVELFL